ncbi:MAG: hypothetical protein LBJ35_02475 [Spirochaetaceae bacterium]|nr:hypothetical protein [Spirochaetaceae bacterium]
MMSKFFLSVLLLCAAASLDALPYIPGCPLHESCVRALRQETQARRRALERRETPDVEGRTSGVYTGFQMDLGDFNDSANDYINLRPSLAYLNSLNSIDLFFCAFYTFSTADPGISPVTDSQSLPPVHRGGLEANVAYSFDIAEAFALTFALDNQNMFVFNPDESSLNGNDKALAYAALEPSLRLAYTLDFGEASILNSLPFHYTDDSSLDYALSLMLNTDGGLGFTLNLEWWNLWAAEKTETGEAASPFEYGQTEVVVHFWRGKFFASLAATADSSFTRFGIEPYAAYTLGRFTLFASVLVNNMGAQPDDTTMRVNLIQGKRDVTSVIPSIGVKYWL